MLCRLYVCCMLTEGKFRSQTSDNMDRWKKQRWEESEKRREEKRREGKGREEKRRGEERRGEKRREGKGSEGKRREEERRGEERREEKRRRKKLKKRKSKKKEDPGARKGKKVAKHCFFPMICGSEGSKSRLAKAAGAEPAGQMRDEKSHAVVARSTFPSQNAQNTSCSDHFWKLKCEEVHAVVARSTFGSQNVQNTPAPEHFWKLRCEKVHAVVARSAFGSQNVQNTAAPEHFWKLWCWKSARRCGAKHISKSKCTKHTSSGPLLEVVMSKREAHFEVKILETPHARTTFGRSDVVSHGRGEGLCTLKKICKEAFSVAGAVQETCSSELLRGPGADLLRRVAFWSIGSSGLLWNDFAWQVQHFVWPGITFSWQAQYFRQVDWKNRKMHWHKAVSSAINFHIWRKSRRIASFLMLSASKSSKNEEVSQNCFVFGVVNFEIFEKLRKSLRVASFSSLQIDR